MQFQGVAEAGVRWIDTICVVVGFSHEEDETTNLAAIDGLMNIEFEGVGH